MEGLNQVSEEFSFEKEKEIARSFSKRFQWEMMLIGLGQATIWLSLWPLVIYGYISLAFGSFLAVICACFAYLPISRSATWEFLKRKSKEKMDRFFYKPLHINNHNVPS
jgi:fatty acid desaturase